MLFRFLRFFLKVPGAHIRPRPLESLARQRTENLMNTVSIYIADSEFQAYLCELIDQQYHEAGSSHFITFLPRVAESCQEYPWDTWAVLPWPLGRGLKRQLGMASRLQTIQSHIAEKCTEAERIIIHSYQIYSERVNCVIAHLRRRFPQVELRVRLIPDGSLNINTRPMTGLRKFPQLFNRLKWLAHPAITTYQYDGDRLGMDCDLCDRIYLPAGFPHAYQPAKVYALQMPRWSGQQPVSHAGNVLVLGTALTRTGYCPPHEMQPIAAKIAETIGALECGEVFYKPHRKETAEYYELWSAGQQVLHTQACVERILKDRAYDVVIGNCSTALITTKLMQPATRVIAVGLDVVQRHARSTRSMVPYLQACQKLGIEIVDVHIKSNTVVPTVVRPTIFPAETRSNHLEEIDLADR